MVSSTNSNSGKARLQYISPEIRCWEYSRNDKLRKTPCCIYLLSQSKKEKKKKKQREMAEHKKLSKHMKNGKA